MRIRVPFRERERETVVLEMGFLGLDLVSPAILNLRERERGGGGGGRRREWCLRTEGVESFGLLQL